MPSIERDKYILYAEIPNSLGRAVEGRMATDRHDRTTVVILALSQYLGVEPPPPAKRGRPKGRRKKKK